MDYSLLKTGQRLTTRKYKLSAETVAKYVDAVNDTSIKYSTMNLVPATAVAALSLRGIIEDLAIPGGTVHAGQELEFRKAVRLGQELSCTATVLQNAVRGNSRFLSLEALVQDSSGDMVMKGKSTIIVPA